MSTLFLHGLEQLFDGLITASWQAAILALLVLALQTSLRGWLNPRWRHALWLLVLMRLILPVLPESAWSLFQFAPPPPATMTATVAQPLFAVDKNSYHAERIWDERCRRYRAGCAVTRPRQDHPQRQS